ncbi:metallophosphoesterase family protein [Streptomyces swartbergensis]|uniref:hypothetical protein n=1 Tax=Streptomyces swartbergensis TaxID=487165 RepID=UPI00381A1084
MADLPVVLAGPILRRVDARHVCVWIALSKPGDVTVTVFLGREPSTGPGRSAGTTVGTQTRTTRRCGAHLHVVVVDVEVVGLLPLTRYCYDVTVTAGGQTKGLKALGLLKDGTGTPKPLALGYGEDLLPSFVTPGARIEDIRIAHASCRKSNGPGQDALAWLDDRIQEGLSNLGKAPQQLYLTGDQIYADDVGGVLLPMLSDLGKDLVGPEELPAGGAKLPATQERFPALRRQGVVRELGRLTTVDGHNHLLTYGEFAAMYCAAFSPAVWRPLKNPADLFRPPPADAAVTRTTDWESAYEGDTEKWKTKPDKHKKSWLDRVTAEAELVRTWRDAVPKVARALANVPTYMIFDDHEITDDWNISERWRRLVISAPLGRAVIRHGLLAYTVFQGWGNDPAAFRHEGTVTETQKSSNEKLLEALTEFADGIGSLPQATLDKVDTLLGIDKVLNNPKVQFHYEVPGALHTVRVLDTRTRRGYKAAGHAPAKLLGGSLDDQLPKGPGGRELLMVVSPVPVLFPRMVESLVQPVAAMVFDLTTHMAGRETATQPGEVIGLRGSEVRDVEGWRADEEHHEQLLRRLGTYRRVVVLSGDVHFASTLTLDFWGKDEAALGSRIVQCTSSAARNQPNGNERGVLRTFRLGQQLLRGVPCERIAWEGEHGIILPPGAAIRPGRRARLRRKPAIVSAQGWPLGTTVGKPPDWRWRLEVNRDDRPRTALPAGAPDVPVLGWDASDRVASYGDIAARHQEVTRAPKDPVRLMVFRNNIGLVSFAADGPDYRVAHTLLSAADEQTGDEFTEHSVRFAPSPAPAAPVLKVQ